jgi:hypothetical protein
MSASGGYVDNIVNGERVALEINCVSNADLSVLKHNIETNLKRPLPRFTDRPGFMMCKGEPLAIVAGGPSVKKLIPRIAEFKNILVCGSAHDFLISQGIVPTYAVASDADPSGYLNNPHKKTTYLLASQCKPEVFDALEGYKVEMWNLRGQIAPEYEEDLAFFQGEGTISWGCTVTLNAIQISMMLGFQDLHFFGLDSCYANDGSSHAYAGPGEDNKIWVEIGEERQCFLTSLAWMAQAEQFFRLVEVDGRYFHSTIHGGGLIAEMVRQGEPGLSDLVSLHA